MDEIERDEEQGAGISRRKVLKGIGAATAIAWTAPIITSIRTPAFAASGPPNCDTSLTDNFNSETSGLDQVNLHNFTVTEGNVDVIGEGTPYDFFPPGQGLYIDFDGTPCVAHTRMESKTTFSACRYRLCFKLAGDQRGNSNNTVTVTFGPYVASFSYPSAQGFTQTCADVTLAVPSKLVFDHDSGGEDCIGMLLDDVSVTPI